MESHGRTCLHVHCSQKYSHCIALKDCGNVSLTTIYCFSRLYLTNSKFPEHFMLEEWSTLAERQSRHRITGIYYRPPTELRKGNVFSYVCLSFFILSVHGGGGEGPHVTIIYDALDLTVQCAPRYQTWDPPPAPQLVTSGGHHWIPVQTCSLEDPGSDMWW